MLRLGIDGRELHKGVCTGIGRYVVQVILAAQKTGMECVVYQAQSSSLPNELPGVECRVLSTWWSVSQDQVALPRQLRNDKISVYLSPYYKGPLFAPCPVVLTIHDLFFIGYPGRTRPFYDRLMTKVSQVYAACATAIITDSTYSKQTIVERLGVAPEKVHVIPLAVPQGMHLQEGTQGREEVTGSAPPYILCVGNFKPHKNLMRLIDAYSQIPRTIRKDVRLVLAGHEDSYRRVLEVYVKNVGLSRSVVFSGAISEKELPGLYSGAQLFVLPSLVEGFGLTALEAMACGCPVAASNRASIPEVVGEAACLFDPENVQSIKESIVCLLTQDDLRERCRRLGFARAKEFIPEKTTSRVLALLASVSGVSPPFTREARKISEEESLKELKKEDLVSR